MTSRVIAHIDLSALLHNLAVVQQKTPASKILAMIKANAYGHGLISIAKTLDHQVGYLGVATVGEAASLRKAHIQSPILLMTGVYDEATWLKASQLNCQIVVHEAAQLRLVQKMRHRPLRVWLKIDTGMHRYGFKASEAKAAYDQLPAETKDDIIWMTHFACSDQPNCPSVQYQIQQFEALTRFSDRPKSLANSGGIVLYPTSHEDIVRPGIMLYGVSPRAGGMGYEDGLRPVMTFKARIVGFHTLEAGESVGYGATWQAPRKSRIALVSAGYADGYPQTIRNGTPVRVNDQQASIAGRVSMDSLTIDVTDIKSIDIGDWVTLWGPEIPVETVARFNQLSPYALLTGVMPRVDYRYAE